MREEEKMQRIRDHAILDSTPIRRQCVLNVDGSPVIAEEGETLAAALLASNIVDFAVKASGAPSSVFCMVGRCGDCQITVDGEPCHLACRTFVKPGMAVRTSR